MVKHTQTNCLSVFDHFVSLALKEMKKLCSIIDALLYITVDIQVYISKFDKLSFNSLATSKPRTKCTYSQYNVYNVCKPCMSF